MRDAESVIVRPAERSDLPSLERLIAWSIEGGWSNFETRRLIPGELEGVWASRRERYPWLVAEAGGEIVGAAWASPWKPKAGYEWTAEISVYVFPQHQGRGAARRLYSRLFSILRLQGYRVLIAGIAVPNEPSVALHESFGMSLVGTFRDMGFKMGAWRSVGYWEHRIDGTDPPPPIRPVAEALRMAASES